jgi:hypothetical protein
MNNELTMGELVPLAVGLALAVLLFGIYAQQVF